MTTTAKRRPKKKSWAKKRVLGVPIKAAKTSKKTSAAEPTVKSRASKRTATAKKVLAEVECPTCGAKPGQACTPLALASGKAQALAAGEIHTKRWRAYERAENAKRPGAPAPAKPSTPGLSPTLLDLARSVRCPLCKAAKGEPCSDSTTTHDARRCIEAALETSWGRACEECGAKPGAPCVGPGGALLDSFATMHARRRALSDEDLAALGVEPPHALGETAVACPTCGVAAGAQCVPVATSEGRRRPLAAGHVHTARQQAHQRALRVHDEPESAAPTPTPAEDPKATRAAKVAENAALPERSVVCPTCNAKVGAPCVRPSGHKTFGGEVHAPRRKAAEASHAAASDGSTSSAAEPLEPALRVECPTCLALPGEPCMRGKGKRKSPSPRPHEARTFAETGLDRACPGCGAGPYEHCKSDDGKRLIDSSKGKLVTHAARRPTAGDPICSVACTQCGAEPGAACRDSKPAGVAVDPNPIHVTVAGSAHIARLQALGLTRECPDCRVARYSYCRNGEGVELHAATGGKAVSHAGRRTVPLALPGAGDTGRADSATAEVDRDVKPANAPLKGRAREVPCPVCQAPAGESCLTPEGVPQTIAHHVRTAMAQRDAGLELSERMRAALSRRGLSLAPNPTRASRGVLDADRATAPAPVTCYECGHVECPITPDCSGCKACAEGTAELARGVCRECGCTDDTPCAGGCSWMGPDETLCSACAERIERETGCEACAGFGYTDDAGETECTACGGDGVARPDASPDVEGDASAGADERVEARAGTAPERIGGHDVHPVASIFPLIEDADLEELARDIAEHGLHEPIWRLPDGRILDGRNRLRACLRAAVPPTFRAYEGATDIPTLIAFVKSLNLARRHLNESQRALVAARTLPLLEKAARERQRAAATQTNAKRRGTLPADLPEASKGEARQHAARELGVSARLVQDAKTVEAHAAPEVMRAVERGTLRVGAAAELSKLDHETQREILERSKGKPGTVRALKRQHDREQLAKELNAKPAPIAFEGPFHVIAADPSWRFALRDSDASHRGVTPYPTMTTQEICDLTIGGKRVAELGHEDSVLFLWTTNAHMDDAHDVARAWGYAPKTIGTWVKPKIGLGHYLRNRTEHFLLCVRGKPTVTLTNQDNVIEAPAREHSRKPEKFYALVESLCPGSKVELFARAPRPGWARWGAETDMFERAS